MSKKSLFTAAAALAYAAALSTAPVAADTRHDSAKDSQTYGEHHKKWGEFASLDKVEGTKVHDSKGEHVGKISDVVFDPSSGRIHYFVLASGGVLGMGEKTYAIPFQAFRLSPDEKYFTLNVDKEKLKSAPETRSDMAYNREFATQVDQYYGVSPTSAAQSDKDRMMSFASFDNMKGMKVTDPKGDHLGKVSDVVFDPSAGRIGYFILASGGAAGVGEKKYAIPFQAFQWKPDQKVLALNIDKERLKDAPEARADMAYDRDFAMRADQFYGVSPSWDYRDKDMRDTGK